MSSDSASGGLEFRVRHFDELPSTNATARQWLDDGCAEGTVIVAERQTAGRGRQGRTWTTLPGALLFSLVLRPRWAVELLPRIGFYACLAGSLAAEEYGLARSGVKWPNDLVLPAAPDPAGGAVNGAPLASSAGTPAGQPAGGDHAAGGVAPDGGEMAWPKWGGVLVEAVVKSPGLTGVIVGVGLNVGPVDPALIEDQGFPCASLSNAVGKAIEPGEFLQSWLRRLGEYYGGPEAGEWERARREWQQRDVLFGRFIRATVGGGMVEGTALGINARGALRVECNGETTWLDAGEVHLQREAESPTGS